MLKQWKKMFAFLVPAAALCLSLAGQAPAAQPKRPAPPPKVSYRMELLGPADTDHFAHAMNNRGDVVGHVRVGYLQDLGVLDSGFLSYVNSRGKREWIVLIQRDENGQIVPGVYDPDDLLSGWMLTVAADINDPDEEGNFQIAGQAVKIVRPGAASYRLTLREIEGVLTVVGFDLVGVVSEDGNTYTNATGLSKDGCVSGDYEPPDKRWRWSVFLWTEEGGMEFLGVPPGALYAIPATMNNSCQITGYAQYASASGQAAHYCAFRYTPKLGFQNLGVIGVKNERKDQKFSLGHDINDFGDVVGVSKIAIEVKGSVLIHAFLYTDKDGMLDIDTLGSGWSSATGINNRQEIVGYSDKSPTGLFLWRAQHGMALVEITNISDFTQSGKVFKVNYSRGHRINDSGLICVRATWPADLEFRVFLLTPVQR